MLMWAPRTLRSQSVPVRAASTIIGINTNNEVEIIYATIKMFCLFWFWV